jgi:predicted permease
VPLLASIFAGDILPVFVIAAIGFFLARKSDVSVKTLSTVSFNALSPCLVFTQLATSTISSSKAGKVALYFFLLTAAMAVCARLAAALLRLDVETRSSFLLVTMFSNSGNYALPVILFAFGREALSYATVYFVSSAIAVYTVGVAIAAGPRTFRRALIGIAKTPAVYALLAAGLVRVWDIAPPIAFMRPVSLLGDAAIPIMLLVLGMQLQRATVHKTAGAVAVAAALSLIASPILGILLAMLLDLSGAARQAAIVLAAMPSAVVTTVLAVEYDLDPSFATNVVFVTTLLSPFTLVFLIAYLQQ